MERDIELNYVKSADDLDVQVVGGDLKLGSSLANRIIISLFTWAAPNNGDNVPDGVTPGGYWGDNVASRDTETPGTLDRAFGNWTEKSRMKRPNWWKHTPGNRCLGWERMKTLLNSRLPPPDMAFHRLI